MTHTEADFERLSWSDCHIWAIELRGGSFNGAGPDQVDAPEHVDGSDEVEPTSDLVLDIDFIVESICAGRQFRVAPANLVFHGVTDPRIKIEWGASGFRPSLKPALVASVERELLEGQKIFTDRPYYRWRIGLSWPDESEIVFGAVGFTQTLYADPVLTEAQCLSFRERSLLKGG